jgi:molecular chaperone DnaK
MPDFEHGPARDPLERLSELAASGSARAHGMPAEQVRALGARRHRRRIAVTLAAASLAVAVLAGGAMAVAGQLDRTSRTPQPVDSPSPSLTPPTPTKSEKLTPGSRPGPGDRAFESGTGKGNARGRAGIGSQPSTRDAGKPAARPARPAPSPHRPPSYQRPDNPPAAEPPTEPPTTEPPPTEPPTMEPPPTEPPADPPPSEEPASESDASTAQ